MTLDMVVRALGLLLPDVPTGVETLDGYVTVKLGALAQPGQSLLRGGFRLTVLRDAQRTRAAPARGTSPRAAPTP
jgi:CBS domain containing-hemolysin-like protein